MSTPGVAIVDEIGGESECSVDVKKLCVNDTGIIYMYYIHMHAYL